MATPAEVEAYIRQAAAARGVPDWLAVGVARAESGLNFDSAGDWWVDYLHYPAGTQVIARTPTGVIVPRGTPGAVPTSFGPFQLRAGRRVTGNASEAGLGDGAVAAGIDVTNPATWQQQVDFALNEAAQAGTFAGVWSTAVGELAARFVGRSVPVGGPKLGTAPIPPLTGGAPMVPGMPEPGAPSGPAPAPAIAPIAPPNPLGGFGDSLGGVASAIGALPAAIATPFVDAINRAYATLAWLGQTHIWERIGLVLVGAVLVLVGLVLFGVSFVPRDTAVAAARAVV